MQPVAMTLLLVAAFGFFAYSAYRRWRLMLAARAPLNRTDHLPERIRSVVVYMFGQLRMPRYAAAGWAHVLVFFGFSVLLLNSIILWVRGYDADFNAWIFGPSQPLGIAYAFLRDIFTVLVIVGVLVFFWNRLVLRLKRLTLNAEGVAILSIILTMMLADLVYEGGEILHWSKAGQISGTFVGFMPFASITANIMAPLPEPAVNALWHAGFWIHAGLVLLFLNLLPYGKHFHILTVLPNVFARDLSHGRLPPIEDIEGRLEREETLGVKTAHDFSWKAVLDFYTCTECGRCSDHCPATNTGKLLSPKHLTIDLRDYFYQHDATLVGAEATNADGNGNGDDASANGMLVPAVVNPEVLWACTTCGACEQECPVFISYIDKIVDLRRNLVMEQGEFPEQLQQMFRGLETVGNPYSIPNEQRADWAAGLDVPLMSDNPNDVEYLYWVGCSPSFDDRARRIAVALLKLLQAANVKFAILGPEETCNGDPARRAGNEYLFEILARQNVETLKGYDVKKIVTTCPHCFNTLRNEYPDFDGCFEVVHHTTLLSELVKTGKLKLPRTERGAATYHDACYLGRHNNVYDAPRDLLKAAGFDLREPTASRDRGMCCGAGGAQMWKEEEESRGDNASRVNHRRVSQLLPVLPAGATAAAPANDEAKTAESSTQAVSRGVIASGCPFCKTMLSDSLADQSITDVAQHDIAELLASALPASTDSPPDTNGANTS